MSPFPRRTPVATCRPGHLWRIGFLAGAVVLVIVLAAVLGARRIARQQQLRDLHAEIASLEAAERWTEAADRCEALLKLRPADIAVQFRYAENVDRAATIPGMQNRALQLYLQVLDKVQDHSLRRRVADLFIDLKQYNAAKEQAELLLKDDPRDGHAWCVKLQAAHREARILGASSLEALAALLPAAIDACADLPQTAQRLARLCQEELDLLDKEVRQRTALSVLDALVERHPTATAHLARFRYLFDYQLPGASADIERALELAPDNADVLLAAGQFALWRHDDADALHHFGKMVQIHPRTRWGYVGLADAQRRLGRQKEALDTCISGLAAVSKTDEILLLSGIEHSIQAGLLDVANSALEEVNRTAERNAPAGDPRQRTIIYTWLPYLRGVWFMRQGNLALAMQRLRWALSVIDESGLSRRLIPEAIKIHRSLAECLLARSEWDLAAAEYDSLMELDPHDPANAIGAAEAWDRCGRLDLAIGALDRAARVGALSSAQWGVLARLRWKQQLQTPPENRDWKSVRAALASARAIDKLDAGMIIVQAKLATSLGQEREAESVLRAALHRRRDDESLARALVELLIRQGRDGEARQVVVDYEFYHPNEARSLLLRGQLVGMRGDITREIQLLTERVAGLPPTERPAVMWRLAELSRKSGATETAQRWLGELISLERNRFEAYEQLIELAHDAGNFEEANQWISRLQEVEGVHGTKWRYRWGLVQLAQATSSADPRVMDAARVQSEIEFLRPAWSAGYVLKGLVAERRGKWPAAEEAYRRAIELGDDGVVAVRQLVRLLIVQEQFAEADRFLARLKDQVDLYQELSTSLIASMSRQGKAAQAVELGARRLRASPNDSAAYLQQARLLVLAGQRAEAEVMLRQVVDRWPENPRAWQALLDLYLRTERPRQAHHMLENLQQNQSLTSGDREFLLGYGYDELRDWQQADPHYREAFRLFPQNPLLARHMAVFFLGRDDDLARRARGKLFELMHHSNDARRSLAALFIQRGGPAHWQEAQTLLDELETADHAEPASAADLRMRALVAIRRGGPTAMQQARELLETVVSDPDEATAEDRYFLGQVYAAQGQFDRAAEQFDHLLLDSEVPLEYATSDIAWLLSRGAYDEAGLRLKQLEALYPGSLFGVGSKIRWLARGGRNQQNQTAIDGQVAAVALPEHPSSIRAILCRVVAATYDGLGDAEAAEQWHRRAMAVDARAFPALAGWLAAHDRVSDAVQACLDAIPNTTGTAALVQACALTRGRSLSETLRQQLEAAISAAFETGCNDPALLLSVANFWTYQSQRRQEAIHLYRKLIGMQAANSEAIKNLAILLSEDEQTRHESLRLLDRLQLMVGRQAWLSDTRALLLLRMGRSAEAIELLEPLVELSDTLPTFRFHLALAYNAAGDANRARSEMEKVQRDALAVRLTVGEQLAWEQLENSLGMAK